MYRRIYSTTLALFLVLQFLFISCKGDMYESAKNMKSAPDRTLAEDESRVSGNKPVIDGKRDRGKKKAGKEGLKTYLISPADLAMGRLLEYTVSLTYKTDDLYKSRQILFEMVPQYGFIKNSKSSINGNRAYMNSSISVKSEKLYTALLEFSKLGNLMNENISVFDHTENMSLSERKAKREQLRILRRNRASEQVTARSKTWKDTELSLERSENSLDKSEHEKWKIRDRVSWATVNISLSGQEVPDITQIQVPSYSNAFKEMINILLQLVYLLIVVLPFVVVVSIIIWKRKIISGIFPVGKKNNNKGTRKSKQK